MLTTAHPAIETRTLSKRDVSAFFSDREFDGPKSFQLESYDGDGASLRVELAHELSTPLLQLKARMLALGSGLKTSLLPLVGQKGRFGRTRTTL